jgi:hypothetical protein
VLTSVDSHAGKAIHDIGVGIEPDCSEQSRTGCFVAKGEVEAIIPMDRVTLDAVKSATNLMPRVFIHLRQWAGICHNGMISHTE